MYYNFIVILRFIATILITNSHYNLIWPIAAFATGGSLGNTLFFAISGFCLSNVTEQKFLLWMKNRLIRIYPQVFVITFFVFLLLRNEIKNIKDIINNFIYPTQFWFISAIMLFYVIFYIIENYASRYINKILLLLIGLYFFVYIFILDTGIWVIEDNSHFKWIYYLFVMISASQIKKDKGILLEKIKVNWLIIVGITVISYFLIKILLLLFPILMHLQFILHITSYIFMIGCFLGGLKYEKSISRYSSSKLFSIVSFIGSLSLEIYLVQTFIIDKFNHIIFPINFILVTALIIINAWILKLVALGLIKLFNKNWIKKFLKKRLVD